MPDMLKVKPAVVDNVVQVVRNPNRAMRPLKAEGELVPASTYWLRRLKSGCVVEVKDDVAPASAPTPAPAAASDVTPPSSPAPAASKGR